MKHLAIQTVLAASLLGCSGDHPLGNGQYREPVLRIANWLDTVAIATPQGLTWPTQSGGSEVSTSLYAGVPGVVLFHLELCDQTGDRRFLDRAVRGADYLTAVWKEQTEAGLYTGVAGTAFCLIETYKRSGQERHRRAAREVVRMLGETARGGSEGVAWNDSTDIISGTAGIGLFLMYASDELGEPEALELAGKAGRNLLGLAQPSGTGLKWSMSPDDPRLMPNFSHGTAGIAYFLASLSERTGEKDLLEAAIRGARYLLEVADTTEGGCKVFHHEPGGENLFYLGWCHGPVGTARLFYRLWEATGDSEWLAWVEKSARTVMNSGIPDVVEEGFWRNFGQCCGSAGIAEFFLDLFVATGRSEYLEFSRRVADSLLSSASKVDSGIYWSHAEHRVRPDELTAQTGYMQGASGIGILLLHLEQNPGEVWDRKIVFPDTPFGRIPTIRRNVDELVQQK